MISLNYALGLGLWKLVILFLNCVDSKRKTPITKEAKGHNDRITPLADSMIDMLRKYNYFYFDRLLIYRRPCGTCL